MADKGDIRNECPWSSQLSHRQHVASRCHAAIRHQYCAAHNALIWWLESDDSSGQRKTRHLWLWSLGTCSALQVGLGDPSIASASLFPQTFVCGIVRVSVSWNGTILCSPSSIRAANTGPSFHLQSLCTSRSNHLPFRTATEVLGRHSHVFPSVCMVKGQTF